jgi:hypothetical protein
LASFAIWFFFLSLVVGFFAMLIIFFTESGGAESRERTGYRYNFNEHQNYWNEDK